MEQFLTSNDTKWKLLRTIVEAVLGMIVSNVDYIAGCVIMEPHVRALVCAFVVAIISPILSEIGKKVYK